LAPDASSRSAEFSVIRRTSPGSFSERGTHEGLTLSTQLGGRSSDVQPQDFGEEVSWDRGLGHLEGDVVAVAGDLRWGSPAFAQEIAEIIDEGMKLKADGVGGE
jgi:hypothetical protein